MFSSKNFTMLLGHCSSKPPQSYRIYITQTFNITLLLLLVYEVIKVFSDGYHDDFLK